MADPPHAGAHLAVLGSPIAHSRYPALHGAAYRRLGLDWTYEAAEVDAAGLAGFIASRDERWLGLSLTMPLKQTVLELLATRDRVAEVTGAANTVLFDRRASGTAGPAVLHGFNTDVAGIVRALGDAGVRAARHVQILGGGATASSALVAASELGAEDVLVSARTVARAAHLEVLGRVLGPAVRIRPLGVTAADEPVPDVVISTVPGGADVSGSFPDAARRQAVLLDVAYDPWPSRLCTAWETAGGTAVSGLAMLVHQALGQVRVFLTGDPLAPVPDEDAVLADMRAAVGLAPHGRPLP